MIAYASFLPGGYDPAKPNGNAAAWWDSSARLYWTQTAEFVATSRPFTDAENAYADSMVDRSAAVKQTIRDGVPALQAIADGAAADATGPAATLLSGVTAARQSAQSQQATVTAARQSLATQKAAVDGLTPGATYSQAAMVTVRNAISDSLARVDLAYQGVADLLARLDGIFAALDNTVTYRINGVDPAVRTIASDEVWLAQVVAGLLDKGA